MDFKPKVSNVSKGLNDRGTWVLSVNHKGLHPSEGRDVRASAERKLLFFGNVTHYLCFFKHTEIQPEKVPARRKIMTLLNNCLANRISINSYSDMPCSHLSPTNCNMTIRSPGRYWHERKWLWTQSFLRSKDCPTFHNDVGEQKSLRSSNGLQGWADNKHSLIKLFEKVRLPLGLLWEQQSSWFIAIQCPSFLILM